MLLLSWLESICNVDSFDRVFDPHYTFHLPPPPPPHLFQLFEVDVLLMGYVNFLGPRVQDGKFVIPCPKFLILMLGKLST